MTPILLVAAAAAYAVASGFFLAWLLRYDPRARRSGTAFTVLATLLATVAAGLELGLSPEPSLGLAGDVLLLITVGLSATFVISRLRTEMPLSGPVIAPLATAVVFALSVQALRGELPSTSESLGAVTILHIGATMLGFLLFAPAYALSVLFLHQQYNLKAKRTGKSLLPSLQRLEETAWRLLHAGFPLYSVGVLLGFVWQEQAGLDTAYRPEHVLAAASWFVFAYATYRHLRSGWRGRQAALTIMAAFVATLAAVLLYAMR